jgi:CheY-like chemotaxis protein
MNLQISKQLKLSGKRILLIDSNQPTRDVRANVLRSRGLEVHVTESLRAARFLWQPNVYEMILLDVRRHLPGEALEFYEQIKDANPREHFVFLVGPPAYLSRTWPEELLALEKEPQQWAETARRFGAVA